MSAIERTTIRGTDYAVTRLDPLTGGRLAARVGRILAAGLSDEAAVAQVIQTFKDAQTAPEANAADAFLQPKLLAALAGGAKAVDTDELYDCALQFARGRLFAGQAKLHDDAAFNRHFTEHPEHLLLVLAWVLKVNCSGFFGIAGRA